MSSPETDRPQSNTPAPKPKGGLFTRRRSLKSPNEALQPESAPPPPEKKKKKRRDGTLSAMSAFLTVLLAALIGVGFGVVTLQKNLREPGPLTADKMVYIPAGTDVGDIIATLEREGVIDSPLLFNMQLWLEQSRNKLKAGEYQFKQQASLRDVLDTLVKGKQILHSVPIPEGLTSEQIVERLKDFDFLAGEVREIPKEGTLLPDTYRVSRGMARADLIRKMQDDQKNLLRQIWDRRSADLPLKTPYELVTLASIVEKETGRADERTRVAGVFINRLIKRMRLQSDPTIVYGIVGGKGTLGRGITRSEIDKWTAYNTYAIDGLPPGPIANPGRAAMEAVANPSRTMDLYFVADGTGGHVFAETLDQHNRNVSRWRALEKQRGAAPGADRTAPEPGADAAPGLTPGRRSEVNPGTIFGALAPIDPKPSLAGEKVSLEPREEELRKRGLTMMSATDLQRYGAVVEEAPIAALPEKQTTQVSVAQMPAPAAATKTAKAPAEKPKNESKIGPTPDFGKLNIPVAGVDLDAEEDAAPANPNAPASYPVNPKTLADQRARAARLGLNPIVDGPAPPVEPSEVKDVRQSVAAYAPDPKRPRAFDASEGTDLDPLKNKTWDLNSPKTVPTRAQLR